ncbi:MAG: hypothetical protein OHK0012_19140 [Synechococcales cyanobacterium]
MPFFQTELDVDRTYLEVKVMTSRMSFSPKDPRSVAQEGHSSQETQYLRLKLEISPRHSRDPLVSKLAVDHGLAVVILSAQVQPGQWGVMELELQGSLRQIHQGLSYLEGQDVLISGKPVPTGDSWHY